MTCVSAGSSDVGDSLCPVLEFISEELNIMAVVLNFPAVVIQKKSAQGCEILICIFYFQKRSPSVCLSKSIWILRPCQ